MKKTIAMIPCAGRGSRMLSLTDDMPKAMLPLHNKPLIGWHLDKLIEEGIEDVCLIVGYKKEKLIEYVDRFYSDKINVYYAEQQQLNGLAVAIHIGIDKLAESIDISQRNLLIILGDTIVKDELSPIIKNDDNVIGYYKVQDYKRWCLIQTKDNVVTNFIDKPDTDPKTRKAVIGVYFFTDIELLRENIGDIVFYGIKIKNEFQLSSAMEIYMETSTIKAVEFKEWFDCGDIETFSETRKNISRYFNSVEITRDNTIIKKSTNEKKIRDEINWFLNIPNKLRVYVPQLIDYNVDKNKTFYELEYVNFSPVHELFLYTMPDLPDWEKLLKNTFNMIERFKVYSFKARFNTEKHLKNILIDKTEQRITNLCLNENGEYWSNLIYNYHSIEINGRMYKNYPLIYKEIENFVNYNIIPNSQKYWQLIHGDLFFGNMLYDINSDTLKIIDPRGNFGLDGAYGDIRYDLAKLNHSIVGKYDFIVNKLYALTYENRDSFEYIMYDSEQKHSKLEALFKSYVEKYNFDYEEITVITGLLFLSMIPLHKDNFENQKMFYLKAIEIFNKVF